jgi:hypothetical protein
VYRSKLAKQPRKELVPLLETAGREKANIPTTRTGEERRQK